MLWDHGRKQIDDGTVLLPLTQAHGGGPTQASICEDGQYWTGKLYVRNDGVVVFIDQNAIRNAE